jgi:hypothetical protein
MNGEPKAVKVTLVTGFLGTVAVGCKKLLREHRTAAVNSPLPAGVLFHAPLQYKVLDESLFLS